MKTMTHFQFVTLFLILSGCKVLSKQETKSVQALSKAMAISSGMPSEYTRQYYNVALESNQLLISIIPTTPSEKIKELKGLIQDRIEADRIVKGYSSGYGVLNKYAELLLVLSNDSTYQKELTKQKDGFMPAFDTLVSRYNTFNPGNKIPVTSFGNILSNIIQEIGSRRIRYLQRKYLKDLISTADTFVAQICDQYISLDFDKNNKQVTSLSKTLDEHYRQFIIYINLDSSHSIPYNYFNIYDPIYIDWKTKEGLLKELNEKNRNTMTNLKSAHHKLKELLDKKATIKELAANLYNVYASVNSLKESYQKFQKDLTTSN